MATINPDNTVAATATLAALALQTAQGQVGQRENPIGSNKGPMVDEYLKAVGLNPGYAWCQAFVYWCYEQAAAKLGIANPVIKTAAVYDCWNRTIQKPATKTTGAIKLLKKAVAQQPAMLRPGDQFILTFGRCAGHTGMVEKTALLPDGTMAIHTIEGNSNDDGSREGYEVVRHVRHITDKALQGFIQYT